MGLLKVSVIFLLSLVTMTLAQPPGCKIRITDRGLEMLKAETKNFVEGELSNITMPEMRGSEGRFQYTIKDVKVTELNLTSDLRFQPEVGLLFDVQNSSITLNFQRRILYWLFYDEGAINASAEGVNIFTVLHLSKDEEGRLKISNITCDASIAKMRAKFGGTLGRVYDFIGTFLTTGMRFILNRQICPALNHAALVLVNQLLETIPVRTEVDNYVGIDYSLLSDPVVTESSLDMDFKGMFYSLKNENDTLVNYAVNPVVREYDRMVYLSLSEYFFDSGLFSYFKGGLFQTRIANERMPKDLELLLRTTYLGTMMMLNPALMDQPLSLEIEVTSPPRSTIKTSGANVAVTSMVKVLVHPAGKPPVQLSIMTMEGKFNAKVSMKAKRLSIHLDLRRFKIYSNQSALESLALIPLQGPLKTMLQISVVPLINNYIKRGVQIPLPDGLDFIEEVVEYHNGYIIVGANLHFRTSLRELIENRLSARTDNTV
ncbi:phospholipid transfer protein [Pimephales promelas]|uniref:phospholipid transfer protein n=1 Tax=Pimephales promelas TaxID=90988 RepID=UPI0019556358|nr:phospholipid transfer protein [Pimephales promelas]XP_039549274.1 phospholipid transfer protein [Pimephales promelas]KAG1963329.1 BPI fold-containing family C protein [Pimephales promelas]KAG1963330.1 BPI fold-containing family C protein [Pimephales promelas]KAG1963331.1 BPI fold-containing family C protein [Pimephales promelas]KAG1963332.1 BPI fold-containing family C protein [Pimephales promelas]KAG1963333.1 BPI fold-containing family C protein [Pimephales promelas]